MTTQEILTEAETARIEYVNAKNAALEYAGCKSLKSLKKDPKFIELTNDILMAKKLWYDYNTAALINN